MASKTKKEHYVPRCYLDAWCIPDTKQIHVYDKKTDSYRINNIMDTASERYFYDAKPKDVIPESLLNQLQSMGFQINDEEPSQAIERAFAEGIEKPLSELLDYMIQQAVTATPWYIKNCYFMRENQKTDFCVQLTLQLLRTKRVRNGIRNTADCVAQMLNQMGASEETLKEYSVSKETVKNIHLGMLLDAESLIEVAQCFCRLTWVLGINRTQNKLFTSDSPIGTYGHIRNPILSMSGIGSKGVEVFFPLSPDVVLIMIDGDYHKFWKPYERRIFEITDPSMIDFYNSLLAYEAERFVYSSDGKMTVIREMKKKAPGIFSQPSMELMWGGQRFFPRNDE